LLLRYAAWDKIGAPSAVHFFPLVDAKEIAT